MKKIIANIDMTNDRLYQAIASRLVESHQLYNPKDKQFYSSETIGTVDDLIFRLVDRDIDSYKIIDHVMFAIHHCEPLQILVTDYINNTIDNDPYEGSFGYETLD